ncbi:MAG TPA: hypothetical protein VMU86_07000, partial [Steroidobacteraceae bacterium]|nr:hypothetical protein [Steroidobacteraceae bacterium]
TPFPPNTAGLPVCPNSDPTTGECACPSTGQCGSGMVNALAAVESAERPIAAVVLPATVASGQSATFDASGSATSCNRTIAGYSWAVSGGVQLAGASNGAQVTVIPGTTAGTLTLTVTDSAGATDTATIDVPANGAPSAPGVPSSAGGSTNACPTPVAFSAAVPTVTAALAPASVSTNMVSTLTITFANSNPFALTEGSFNYALPSGLTIASSPQTTTSCTGGEMSANYTATTVTITGAVIPVNGNCSVTIPVESASAGSYTISVGPGALSTGPAGPNADTATASLSVTSSHGGGAVGWPTLLVGAAVLVAVRRRRAA